MNSPIRLPKKYNQHNGASFHDMPQELFRFPDYEQIEVFRRDGEEEIMPICEINWKSTYLKSDVIGYKLIGEKNVSEDV